MQRVTIFMIIAVSLVVSASFGAPVDSLATATDSATDTPPISANSALEVAVAPLCTLEITTNPPGAAVVLDDAPVGASPVSVVNVALGKHTLILQKAGYYQKKVMVTLSTTQKTPLHFDLSAPGILSIHSTPDSAAVYIDGALKGSTPYVDSLVKPGTYHLRIEKPPFMPIVDSCSIVPKMATLISDTLRLSQAYQDSVAYVKEAGSLKAKKFSYGLIGGAFGLFLMLILTIEGLDR